MANIKVKITSCLEFAGKQYFISDMERKVRQLLKARHPGMNVQNVVLYMQPEVGYVYYTLDGVGSPESYFSFEELADM